MAGDNTLTRYDEERDARIGRIVDDFVSRRARGERVSESALLAQHADIADELREHLELLRDLRPAASKIEELVAQGMLAASADPRYRAELGPYKVLDFVGRGGMGIVLKAHDESLDRVVALKILRPELAEDEAALVRFEREAKTAAALQHPNIVTVYGVGHECGVRFIAMEYVDGPSLAEVVREQSAFSYQPSAGMRELPARSSQLSAGASRAAPTETPDRASQRASLPSHLPTALIRHIFRELLSGLDAAHRAGLIHRDIKSSNILLEASRQPSAISLQPDESGGADVAESQELRADGLLVKLADFGLARMRSSQTQLTLPASVLGTPEYMSPEQARGEADIDERTDLYSAGVVLYEMLTGRTPFRCDTPTATIHQILNEEPHDPRKFDKSIDPVLASLALRLMAKRREERLASAGEALKALEAGARVRRPRTVQPGFRRVALAVVLVGALGAGAWWLSRIGRAGEGLTEVRTVEYKDGGRTRYALEGRYGNRADWERLNWVLPNYRGEIRAATLADLDGTGDHKVLVAGLMQPLGENDVALVAFNADRTERWRCSLTPNPNELWPNCVRKDPWLCDRVVAKDLDGKPVAELVAVARTNSCEYPARISVVDAASGGIRSTFWHMGLIVDVCVIGNFFDDGRPALVAWGTNNKLDGFDDDQRPGFESRRDGDDPPRTEWDYVPMLVILDPAAAKMEGLGPPRTRRLDWLVGDDAPPARPYAYAFLDMAHDELQGRRRPGSDVRDRVEPQDAATIDTIFVLAEGERSTESAWLNVMVDRGPVGARGKHGGAHLKLDRSLNITNVMRAPGEPASEDWWSEHWHVIIREGEYLPDAAP